MKRFFAAKNKTIYRNQYVNLTQQLQVFILLLLLPTIVFGQEMKAEIHGYLMDEQTGRKLTDIMVVNQTSGDFVYGNEEGNYSIEAKKKDVLVFSALGYSSSNFSLNDSASKPVYFVVPKLNKYSIIIREVSIEAEREVAAITGELNNLTWRYYQYAQAGESVSSQFLHPISALHNKWSKREESKHKVLHFKYLDRKRILLRELIRRSKLSQTKLLSIEEQNAFVDYLLKYDYKLLYLTQYELLAYINEECKKWVGVQDNYHVRSRSR